MKIGDVVILKSGSRHMTVIDILSLTLVRCEWWDVEEKKYAADFRASGLKLIRKAKQAEQSAPEIDAEDDETLTKE